MADNSDRKKANDGHRFRLRLGREVTCESKNNPGMSELVNTTAAVTSSPQHASAPLSQILDAAKAEVEKIKADAQRVAENTMKAARAVDEQVIADAKKQAAARK